MTLTEGIPARQLPAWACLEGYAATASGLQLAEMFRVDPARGTRLAAEACGVYLDYSKNLVRDEIVAALLELARQSGLRQHIDAMFAGEKINTSDHQPALHVALRAPRNQSIMVDSVDVVPQVHEALERMAHFAREVRRGTWRGHTGKPIRNVVNIGIGGSDLGPAMAYQALRPYSDRDKVFRFVSNVDGAALIEGVRDLDAAETLFIVCSKSWHTQETLINARSARQWLLAGLGGDTGAVARHFVAVSANLEGAREFGIDPANMFWFWDWVGGRYSLDSAVGLLLMIAIGPERFTLMLAGFHQMDEHFRTAPFEANLPILLGLLSVWYNNFLGAQTVTILPYSESLARLPAYLQQLEMESNGKRVDLAGRPVDWQTSPVVWGEPGTNGQHAFYQALHQGTKLVPAELIGFWNPVEDLGNHHDVLMANMFAQSEALAFGRGEAALERAGIAPAQIPYRVCPGNRPSTLILLDRLTPENLGKLIALYEHRVFTEGTVWGIDSFDQWGVEAGKVLARTIEDELQSAAPPCLHHDNSTATLIRRYRAARGRSA
jgi:glucose-6-phosphate isomerase